ncbi:MAG: hypothetical protein Pg6C_06150 [Treponemataceae bacterium]|nr:MAG: hypothetical protein Pg6C_06150 [Treponemataceae bacterium]
MYYTAFKARRIIFIKTGASKAAPKTITRIIKLRADALFLSSSA